LFPQVVVMAITTGLHLVAVKEKERDAMWGHKPPQRQGVPRLKNEIAHIYLYMKNNKT
jgi:hypothetical protein